MNVINNKHDRTSNGLGAVIALVIVSIFLCNCGMIADTGDRVTLTGTPKGIQAFADMTNGLIRTGKEPTTQPSEFFAHRKAQEVEETARKAQATGFWDRLVN